MEPEGSSPHSQAPATCPYPKPAQSSPHTLQRKHLAHECFLTGFFFSPGEALLAPRPTPNLEGQDIPFSLGITFDLSGMGDPTSSKLPPA